ncbi:MAG: amidohydrolase [Parvibaculum sp.]|uniref:amidohydrolase n=1 Tax=Parvibaculum sp. TaxID=2024848 RepID=UPI0025FDD748|nr:amidohydrolase [Parvibaculum sp.]MCE9649200.1 amidohydrolase [Parvibaculum sp.]
MSISDTNRPSCCETADPAHRHDDDRYGCPCCAPMLASLGLISLPSLANAGKPAAWKRLGPPPSRPVGTTIVTNATIITADADFSIAEAFAHRDGKIVAIGSLADVKAQAGEDAATVDCAGKTILPGFIEPHMHFFPIAMMDRLANAGALACADADAVIALIGKLARAAAPGEWIVARQFDPSLQPGADRINRHALDAVAPDNPVFIFNASLHIGYCNSKALDIAGVTAATPNPAGAAYLRDADGHPNGVLQGQATMFGVLAHNMTALAIDDVPDACRRVCAKANSVGITTMCDQASGGFQGRREIDAFHAFAASGHMTARLRYSLIQHGAAHWDEMKIRFGDGDEMARATGWKIVSDGSNQGRTGLQRDAYLGRADRGIAYVEAETLKEMVTTRALAGWQVVVHANGDQAIDNALDAFEAAYAAGATRALRFRIEHCSVLHDEQIARIAAMELSPSFLIGHVHYWGKAFRDEIFGPEKSKLLGRAASCSGAGIRWTLHSDEPVSDMNPLRLIDNAVNRSLWKEPGGVLNADERVSVEQAIVAVTRDAAWQCHSDHEVGTLEPGKFADFVVLDRDPRAVPPADIGKIRVLETWLAGRQVYAA